LVFSRFWGDARVYAVILPYGSPKPYSNQIYKGFDPSNSALKGYKFV